MLQSVNPHNENLLARYTESTPAEVDQALLRARQQFSLWKKAPLSERASLLQALADVLEEDKESLAQLATLEMGKPLNQSLAEVQKSARALRHYARQGERILSPRIVDLGDREGEVHFQPLGTVLAIMPWNFPYWQVFRAMGAVLISGNTLVLKHASNVCGSALAIAQSLERAGAPKGLVEVLLLPSSRVEALIRKPEIQAISFTGSTEAGALVAAVAASEIKKQVLELGGSDPYILLEDADLDLAIPLCVEGRMINNGQSCVAAKRFIVHHSLVREVEERMAEEIKKIRMGDPLDPAHQLGPLARADIRDQVADQVNRTRRAGARLITSGSAPSGPGYYYPPTLLSGVQPGMAAFDEEIFGPVAAIIPAGSEAEAIALANRSSYGLGAGIFSRDLPRAQRIAIEEIESGSCFINAMVHSDPRLPFGGVKKSGYGRELGDEGVLEFTNIKTICPF